MSWIRLEAPKDPGPFHWSRKFFHMLGLLIPVLIYADIFHGWTGWKDSTRALGVILIFGSALFVVAIDLLRFRFDGMNQLFLRLFGALMKKEESGHFNAVTPYLISCGILLLFGAREVVVLCCIFLMIGDPSAAYVGSRFGRVRFWNNKSLEGMLAFVLIGFVAGLAFLWIHSIREPSSFFSIWDLEGRLRLRLLGVVFLGAFFAAVAEFFSSIHLKGLWDDNLLVPLGAALGIFVGGLVLYGEGASAFWFPVQSLFQ